VHWAVGLDLGAATALNQLMSNTASPPKALALVGPTASGKTAAALALADRWHAHGGLEIISVDSALVFRGMDIGTAKPTQAELAAVPHHLIDIRDPLSAYSAAEFVRDAEQLMRQIRARGRMPLLVGGTMLYVKALLEGLSDMPPASTEVREGLQQSLLQEGLEALYARLKTIDPITAARLAPADTQRILRALEVWQLTQKPISSFQTRDAQAPPRNDIALISLEPVQRAWLHTRIEQRFDQMLEQGLVQEVQTLRARGDLHADLPAMRCVGYRQVWEALDSPAPQAEMRDKGIFATRQLAKRQITWLRSMRQRHAVAADAKGALTQVIVLAERLMQR